MVNSAKTARPRPRPDVGRSWAMALALAWMLTLNGCSKLTGGGEADEEDEDVDETEQPLSESQCRQLVRTRDRLQTGSNSAVRATRVRNERAEINVCLKRGTPRALRCFKNARDGSDLPNCERLMN